MRTAVLLVAPADTAQRSAHRSRAVAVDPFLDPMQGGFHLGHLVDVALLLQTAKVREQAGAASSLRSDTSYAAAPVGSR